MTKRPRAVTVISWVFIVVCGIALIYHLLPQHRAEAPDLGWICFVRALGVVSGVFMLRGMNWARWLLVVWIAYHVGLSALHSAFEAFVHACLFGIVAYFLFHRRASAYFHSHQPSITPVPSSEL